MVRRDPVFHQPVGQGEVQGGAVHFTQESGTSLAAHVGRNAVLCGSTAFASSLLERRTAMGSDGATPLSHEVEGDFRHSGLGP